jgi:hypothetical protein
VFVLAEGGAGELLGGEEGVWIGEKEGSMCGWEGEVVVDEVGELFQVSAAVVVYGDNRSKERESEN